MTSFVAKLFEKSLGKSFVIGEDYSNTSSEFRLLGIPKGKKLYHDFYVFKRLPSPNRILIQRLKSLNLIKLV